MKHRLLTILAILSFLPIPVLAGIWISSYPRKTLVWPIGRAVVVGSAPVHERHGHVSLSCFHGTLCYRRHVGRPEQVGESYRLQQSDWRWGFGRTVSVNTQDPSRVTTEIHIPCWAVLTVAAIPATWGATFIYGQWLLRYRRRKGLCCHCGYDLRATPAPTGPRLPRCPECGRESGDKEKGKR